jgi:chromosome segregation ATPase
MLTGRQAFEGESQTELKLALSNAAPPPSGSPSVDRLVNSCVSKSPAARWQRMQKIILELKLLTVAARRADKPVVNRGVADAALRTEMQQMEARFAEKLTAYEQRLQDSQAAYEERLKETQSSYEQGLKDAQSAQSTVAAALEALKEQLIAVQERPVQAPLDLDALHDQIRRRVQEATDAVSEQLHAQVTESATAANASAEKQSAEMQQVVAAASQQLESKTGETVAAVNARMEAAEQNMEEIRKHFATLQAHVAGDLHEFEKNMKAQGVAIDSARTAMAQTDDLVERVVEALELLQSSMIDQHESASVN